MVAVANPSAAERRARATSRGYIVRSPRGGWPSRISGTGAEADADAGVHRMPGIPPRVNRRSRTLSSRGCSEVTCMVVPFGSALERRSRTTYRLTVTSGRSTHGDTAFTGTTSSVSRTAAGNVAAVAVAHQRFSSAPWPDTGRWTLFPSSWHGTGGRSRDARDVHPGRAEDRSRLPAARTRTTVRTDPELIVTGSA